MSDPLLVGRDAELATLVALLDDVRASRGRAVVLLGEAGIGKTRLAEALAGGAAGSGLNVAWGRCPDSEVPPYWPWSQVLGHLLGPDTAPFLGGEAQGGRPALFAAVVDALDAATTARPAAVVLEDVHWADASSLALLRFVVGALPGMPLLLALTARDDPRESREEIFTGLANLPPSVMRLPLPGLDKEATAVLVEHVAGRDIADRLAIQIHERTGGNPFFVTEVARLQVVRGGTGAVDVPPGVHQVLSRRLARLSQPSFDLLGAASVVGEPDVEVLAAVTAQPEDRVLELLDEALRDRLVETEAAGFRFAHALVRETLYENLSPALRSRLHRRAAELPGAASPGDRAVHWTRVGGGEAQRKAAACALEAADEAMARMGFEQAVHYYRWALDGGAGDPVTVPRRLGEAQVLAGELSAGRETLRQAAEGARRGGQPEELARAVLAMGSGVGGFEVDVSDRSQIGLLEDARQALPPEDGTLRAAVLARLSLARAGQATPEECTTQAREAAEMARRIGDAGAEAAALAALCDALAGPDHVAERLAAADRMVRLSAAAGDPLLLLLARRLRLVARLERGDLPGVDAEIAAYARTAEHLRLPLYQWPVPVWRGMRALMDGHFDTAWRYSEEAEELGRRAGSANADMMVFSLRMATARARGTIAEVASALLEKWLPWLDEYPGWGCSFAAALADAGRPEEARRYLRVALDAGVEAIPKDSEWLELLWQLGDAAMLLDEPGVARTVHDMLSPYGELWAVDGIGGACFGQVSHQLARLAGYLVEQRTPPEPVTEGEFRREGRLWHLRFRGEAAAVPHLKGMADLAALLAQPGREVHVLDLVEAAGGPSAKLAEGDSGPVLDARARSAYQARLVELEEDITAAEAHADLGQMEHLRAERDFLAAELGGALGLGGRPRTAGDRVERARKAVTMRIATALKTIDAAHPALARHLRLAVATGRFCVYRPESPTVWKT